MLFSIVSVTPVMADSISGTYTFVDTCYSPELGIYVAVKRFKLGNDTGTNICFR